MSIYDELALEDPEAAALKIQNAMRAYLARKYPDDGIDDDVDDEDDVEDDDEYDEDDEDDDEDDDENDQDDEDDDEDEEDEEDDEGDEDDDEDDEDDEDDGVERNPPVFYNLPATPSSMIPMCSLLCTMVRVYLNLTKLLCRLKRVSLQRAIVETRAACNIQKAFRGYLARKHAGKFGLVNQKLDDYDTDSITSEDSSYYSEDSDDDDDEEDGVERNPPLSYILPTTPSSRNPLSPSPTVSLQRAVVERRAARNIQKDFRGYLARKYPGKFDLVNQKLDHYDTDSITSEDEGIICENGEEEEETRGRADDAQEVALFRGGIEELRRAMEVLRENNQNLKTLLDRMCTKS